MLKREQHVAVAEPDAVGNEELAMAVFADDPGMALYVVRWADPFGDDIRWFSQRVSPLRGALGAVIAHFDITD